MGEKLDVVRKHRIRPDMAERADGHAGAKSRAVFDEGQRMHRRNARERAHRASLGLRARLSQHP
ncbi:MAG: hypothetical protein NVS2B5_18610 [Beijerinckiaceae bacterium]